MTIAQQLKIKDFPFEIKDANGNLIYFENSDGYWVKYEYDSKGNQIYYENSEGYWSKSEFDSKGNLIYHEDSDGYWIKCEYNSKGNHIYFETSNGFWYNEIHYENSDDKRIDRRPKTELTLDEIAKKFGIQVSRLKIKK